MKKLVIENKLKGLVCLQVQPRALAAHTRLRSQLTTVSICPPVVPRLPRLHRLLPVLLQRAHALLLEHVQQLLLRTLLIEAGGAVQDVVRERRERPLAPQARQQARRGVKPGVEPSGEDAAAAQRVARPLPRAARVGAMAALRGPPDCDPAAGWLGDPSDQSAE